MSKQKRKTIVQKWYPDLLASLLPRLIADNTLSASGNGYQNDIQAWVTIPRACPTPTPILPFRTW